MDGTPRPRKRSARPGECPKCFRIAEIFTYDGGGLDCRFCKQRFYDDFEQYVKDETALPEKPDTEW